MFLRACFLGLVALASTTCFGQAPQTGLTYRLHAQQPPRNGFSLIPTVAKPISAIAIAPDGSFLVAIPEVQGKWAMKRLSDWATSSPKEETLQVIGDANQDPEASFEADLTVSPDGTQLIVRINARKGAIDDKNMRRDAVIVVVNLRSFTIVSRWITADPLIASSQWRFNNSGLLISKGLAKRSSKKSRGSSSVTDTYEAAALSLPDLKPSLACTFDEILELHDGAMGWTKRLANPGSTECSAVDNAAGVSSADDLPGADSLWVRMSKSLNAGANCTVADYTKDGRLALAWCEAGHPTAWDTKKTTSRSCKVLSVADGKTLFSMSLPFKPVFNAAVVQAEGRAYLLLLRDGTAFEAYRIPE